MATLWIVIAAVFDFGDGFAARSLHAYSPMGKELDSLSDMVKRLYYAHIRFCKQEAYSESDEKAVFRSCYGFTACTCACIIIFFRISFLWKMG